MVKESEKEGFVVIETDIDEQSINEIEEDFKEKKNSVIETLKLAIDEYKDIEDYSTSDLIISEDIGIHMLFGNIGLRVINRN